MNKVLIIRRDNIGDLVLTLPVINAIRTYNPHVDLAVWVNSYNKAIVENCPVINRVYYYTKAKHERSILTRLMHFGRRITQMIQICLWRPDCVIAFQAPKKGLLLWVKCMGARKLITESDAGWFVSPETGTLMQRAKNQVHHVEWNLSYLAPLNIFPQVSAESPIQLQPDAKLLKVYQQQWRNLKKEKVALHLSARLSSQQWDVAKFAQVAQYLISHDKVCMCLWSPGPTNNPHHPGDDEKAQAIKALVPDIILVPTQTLAALIAALSMMDVVICADGGAMHVAAGLGKKVVAMFGESQPLHWHPWACVYEVLRPASHHVQDISVDEVIAAFNRVDKIEYK